MTEREQRIRELEEVSRRLEPDASERARMRDAVVDYSEDFLRHIDELRAFETDRSAVEQLRETPIREEGREIDELLSLLRRAVDTPGLNPASGGHLAYIPGGGLYPSALGDYLAAVTNRYAGIQFTGPGAVEMENMLLDWMAELVGYPGEAGGNLTSGGSIANLVAVVTAREDRDLEPESYGDAVVYVSEQTHHCVDKALRIAGLGDSVRRVVPVDDRYRMDPDALEEAVERDRRAGLLPWMVVGSAGTTDVGAVDPLEAIGDVADRQGLWFHVDAAYGGFFALCESCRELLAGMGRSDSVVLDPHKGLFLPYGSGAVLVKDRAALHRAHHYRADYMQDIQQAEAGRVESPAELSPELTKHFRGLRLWLPLLLHGVEPFRAALEEKRLLARRFWERARERGFQVGPEPELSVAAVRWMPASGADPDAFNEALVEAVREDGRVFLSSTTLDGRFVIRMAALAFRTHVDTVDLTLEILCEKARELEETGPSAT